MDSDMFVVLKSTSEYDNEQLPFSSPYYLYIAAFPDTDPVRWFYAASRIFPVSLADKCNPLYFAKRWCHTSLDAVVRAILFQYNCVFKFNTNIGNLGTKFIGFFK